MIVRENINFERGINPRTFMKIGLDKAITLGFEKMKELDTEKLIDNIYVDGTYPYIYIYIAAKAFAGAFNWEEEEKVNYARETFKNYFDKLMLESGMNEYLDFDSNENADEVSYKVKPAYRKTFYKIHNDLNNT